VGAGVALFVVGGAGIALYLSGAFGGRPERTSSVAASDRGEPEARPEAKGGPADGTPTATTPDTGARGRPFSGKWLLDIRCTYREGYITTTVDFGGMQIDQTSPTTASVSYQDTGLPTPAKAEARIDGDRLSFEWKAKEGHKGQTSYVSFTGRLSEPDTITASVKVVRRKEDVSCSLTAETPEKFKERTKARTPPPSAR
jgi:hypothetical protein